MQIDILFPHTAIYTPNLEASLKFYRAFFGVEPTKLKTGYAKFELLNPRWNFTLNQTPVAPSETAQSIHASGLNQFGLSHLGFQVESTASVKALQARLAELGIMPTLEETGSTCCYAVQDKFWVKSPEGIDWEVFTVLADADVFRDDAPTENPMCCAPSLEPAPISISLPILQ